MDLIQNGELGSSVRAKLNEVISDVNSLNVDVPALQIAEGLSFDTVSALLADSTLTYASGNVAAGNYVLTRSEGFSYLVAASNATDQHVTTAGGLKLYVQPIAGEYHVKAFGGKADGVTNDTTAANAAIAAALADGVGGVFFAAGTWAVMSITATYTSIRTMSIRGAGQRSTEFIKFGAGTDPIFSLDATGVLEIYSKFSGFRITGTAKGHHGIRMTQIARFSVSDLFIGECDVGIESLGSLVFSAYDLTIQGNNIGYRTRKSGSIYANLVQFFGGQISGNTTFAVDIGDGAGFNFYGTDMSNNGTAANLATGAVKIRSTADDEAGISNGNFHNCWFEINKGMTIDVEACAGLSLSFSGSTLLLGSEGGNCMNIGAIRSVHLQNVIAATAGDTVTVAAQNFKCEGGIIAVIVDNSTVTSAVIGTDTQAAGTGVRASQFNPKIGGTTSYGIAPGVAYKLAGSAGNIGTGEDNLMSYTLPANAMNAASRGVRITAYGYTATNANAKTLRVYFGATLIGSLSLTIGQFSSWRCDGEVLWEAGSLMRATMQIIQGGTVTKFDCKGTTVTHDPTTSALVRVTGEATADFDIEQIGMIVEFIA
jgi:hypothetical protein